MKPTLSLETALHRRLLQEQFPGGTQGRGALTAASERLQSAGLRLIGPLTWVADYAADGVELSVQGSVGIRCTRCLADLAPTLEASRRFRLFDTSAEADEALSLEDSREETVSTEDALSILDLIEDELLLSMDDLMVHAGCTLPDQPEPDPRPQPFAQLAALLHQKGKQ